MKDVECQNACMRGLYKEERCGETQDRAVKAYDKTKTYAHCPSKNVAASQCALPIVDMAPGIEPKRTRLAANALRVRTRSSAPMHTTPLVRTGEAEPMIAGQSASLPCEIVAAREPSMWPQRAQSPSKPVTA